MIIQISLLWLVFCPCCAAAWTVCDVFSRRFFITSWTGTSVYCRVISQSTKLQSCLLMTAQLHIGYVCVFLSSGLQWYSFRTILCQFLSSVFCLFLAHISSWRYLVPFWSYLPSSWKVVQKRIQSKFSCFWAPYFKGRDPNFWPSLHSLSVVWESLMETGRFFGWNFLERWNVAQRTRPNVPAIFKKIIYYCSCYRQPGIKHHNHWWGLNSECFWLCNIFQSLWSCEIHN